MRKQIHIVNGFIALVVTGVSLTYASASRPDIYTNDPDTGKCTLLTEYTHDPLGQRIVGAYGLFDPDHPCPMSVLLVALKTQ